LPVSGINQGGAAAGGRELRIGDFLRFINAAASRSDNSLRMARILVVEDHRVNQRLIEKILQRGGHFPDLAGNGKEALELLDTGRTYDVVLMDIQMPVMDGLTAARAIRNASAAYANVPIIALTAYALDEYRVICAAAGMTGFVAKPIITSVLFFEIERVLNETDAASAQERSRERVARSSSQSLAYFKNT
jgi:CheY-like chemotaxis protein